MEDGYYGFECVRDEATWGQECLGVRGTGAIAF